MQKKIFVFLFVLFFFSCKKKVQTENLKIKNEKNEISHFENVQNENEENDIENLNENEFVENNDFANGAQFLAENEAKKKEQLRKIFRNEKKSLRLFSDDDESFMLSENGKTSVRFSGNDLIRKFFDEKFRLEKKEIWFIADTSEQSKKVSSEFFSYDGDEVFPVSSIVKESEIEKERSFVQNGKLASESVFHLGKKNARELFTKKIRSYTENGLLAEETNLRFQTKFGKTKEIASEKKRYEYDSDEKLKLYQEYHDGKLRVKKLYSSESDYELSIFFDDGYEIVTMYSNGKKTQEKVLLSGLEIRKRLYD